MRKKKINFNNMSLFEMLEFHRLLKSRKKDDGEELLRKTRNIMLERKKVILSALEEARVSMRELKVYGDTLFKFSYKRMLITFFHKRNGLDGEMYRLPKNQEEREILREAHIIADGESQLAEEFRQKSHFEEFYFDGDLLVAVKKILKLAQKLSKAR